MEFILTFTNRLLIDKSSIGALVDDLTPIGCTFDFKVDLGDGDNAVASLILVYCEGTSRTPSQRDIVHAQTGGPPSITERIQYTPYLKVDKGDDILLTSDEASGSRKLLPEDPPTHPVTVP